MVKAVRMTRTTDWATVDDVHTECPWTTQTKYGDASGFNYWTSGSRTTLPVDADASHYEVFTWAQSPSTNGETYYLGPVGTQHQWYGIMRDSAGPKKGSRSGLIPYAASDLNWLQFRSFGSNHFTFDWERLHLAILVDPVPIALAATGNAHQTNLGSVPATNTLIKPTMSFDPDGIYNVSTGLFTAPTGATLVAPCINFSSSPYAIDDTVTLLYKNGVEVARYSEGWSGRSPSAGSFGLWPTVPGDTWSYGVGKPFSSVTFDSFHASMEFY